MTEGASPSADLDSRMRYVERLLNHTRPERITYLVISLVSAVVLIVFATVILIHHGGDVGTLSGLWGASGVVTISNAQILRVWRDALRVALPPTAKEE
jgi:hypothetical protein